MMKQPLNSDTDAHGQPAGFAGFALDDGYAVAYDYDMFGRFQSASSAQSAVSYTYSYLPNTDLLSGITASSGFLWTRAYESTRSLITSVENRYGETVISRYDYQNDALGRRTSRADSGLAFANPAFDTYSYNNRSEVTGAHRYHGTDVSDTSTVYGGRQFGYVYDPIGNRTAASETIGSETLAKAYTANALNQYTDIANPAAVGLRGDATNTAVVTVNGEAVQSDDIASDTIPWHFALAADNGSGPDFPYAEIVAVINPPGTNDPDVVSTTTGHLYAPPQSETLTYDDDGNLLSDGRWHYTWNGENRLIKAEEQVSPTNREPYTVEYAYDHQGRMVWKQISTNAVVVSTRTLLWEGYNIVAEQVGRAVPGEPPTVATNYFVWGLDLSGSLQGAGGVGGLLAEIQDGEPYFAAFDANGNVTEYVSTDGTIAAHYEYSPFGEIVVKSGDMAQSFTHRFSTKPWCSVTGLSEYEKRKFEPGLGRWPSRDPLGDEAFLSDYRARMSDQERVAFQNELWDPLLLFVKNDPVGKIDPLGLWTEIQRKHERWAKTCAQQGDTWQSLADLVHLQANEASLWVKNYTSSPNPGTTYLVPNVFATYTTKRRWWEYIPGHISSLTLWFFIYPAQIAYDNMGYKVIKHIDEDSQGVFKSIWTEEGIAAVAFSGHGYYGPGNWQGITVESSTGVGGTPAIVNPPYKLAQIYGFMCGTYEMPWRQHLSNNNGVFIGYSGDITGADVLAGSKIAVVVKTPSGEDVSITP